MNIIISIIAFLIFIGCGTPASINSMEYSSEQTDMSSHYEYSSSIIDLLSSSSVEIPLQYSSSDIVVTISSSNEEPQSSSSFELSSSSSIQSSSSSELSSSSSISIQSSSPSIQSSSSSIQSSSSFELSSSSFELSSSSSSISIQSSSSSIIEIISSSSLYKTSLYMFDMDSAADGIDFYKRHFGNESTNYEIIGNIIRGYITHYGVDTLTIGETVVTDSIERRKFNRGETRVTDLISNDRFEIIGNDVQTAKIRIVMPNADIETPFVASAIAELYGRKVFVLRRVKWNDRICFWWNAATQMWSASGTHGSEPAFQNICGHVDNYNVY